MVVIVLALLVNPGLAKQFLKLATTTSTYETGLLDHILPPFEKKHNVRVYVISVGTGKAIKLAENGDVDVILVHAKRMEDKFVAEGFGVNRREVMYNDFLIIGPRADPAGICGLKDVQEAMKRIFNTKQRFISRGDDSGTHEIEKHLWVKAKLRPEGEWYLEVGQGMTAVLIIADEKNGYVLIDRATYLVNCNKVRLVKLVEGDKDLLNPYGIIAASPYKHSHVKYELAMTLIGWLTSPECQKLIAAYRKEGGQLFYPSADKPMR
ncbi:MAG: substrate-binding domain-containing protein [Verrucomicrobia bacterium]|nr:substrate-binding domain-containing protein [Verrucomicrobiota bacterium]MBU4291564.1 substrate-binding domain-containing protein [Verrucomicrobiota bacterium]